MLRGGGDEVSMISIISLNGLASVLSIGYFLCWFFFQTFSFCISSISPVTHHIQYYFKKNRGGKRKLINPQQQNLRHE